ncbi:hypothetical protein A3K64_02475 [Candidatus Micrarchaeota archaeon RBG_16_36_9]|nr:MAG: hypothetical protein A3K64_02475 [Candidatus Micrarchaeota archaeon RBG_16_36_9]
MKNNIFIKTTVITVIIFILGILVGLWLDNNRLNEIKDSITSMDIEWNDARLQGIFYQKISNQSSSCEDAIKSNLEFNNRIYQKGIEIEKSENINKFTPEIVYEKRRYALLQLQFWSNSINLKESCNANYSSVVYFYSFFDESKKIDQNIQSIILSNLKEECGNNMILIPLPLDLSISTIDFIKSSYEINSTPSILIDEKTVLTGIQNREDILKYINC